MAADDYNAVPSTGKLKLKGVSDGRIEKKRKKKRPKAEEPEPTNYADSNFEDKSVVLNSLADEDRAITKARDHETEAQVNRDEEESGEDIKSHIQTEAERKFDEQRRKRLEERLKREGVKTHKQRVEELNRYLSSLSEHHDMPKIGPG